MAGLGEVVQCDWKTASCSVAVLVLHFFHAGALLPAALMSQQLFYSCTLLLVIVDARLAVPLSPQLSCVAFPEASLPALIL